MRKDIKNAIIKTRELAQKCADTIINNKELDFASFDDLFTRYMCYKFMLSPGELATDNFYEICQLSAEKSANLPKGMLDASELASKCGGATTAMNKKVLFLLAVNREMGIEIAAEESVQIETFSQLKKNVYHKITNMHLSDCI